METARDRGSIRQITWISDFEFVTSLENEKAFRKMSVTFAHYWLQTQSSDNFKDVFDAAQPQPKQVLESFHDHTSNLKSVFRKKRHRRRPTLV